MELTFVYGMHVQRRIISQSICPASSRIINQSQKRQLQRLQFTCHEELPWRGGLPRPPFCSPAPPFRSLREFNDSPSKENALVMCHTAMFYHISTIAETKFDL
eukprot:scaffold113426_cov16-Tisochrysis_lutea.AAC.1